MSGWCETCHNTGSVDCYCGGDLCVCENYGEMPCPACDGQPGDEHDDDHFEYPDHGWRYG